MDNFLSCANVKNGRLMVFALGEKECNICFSIWGQCEPRGRLINRVDFFQMGIWIVFFKRGMCLFVNGVDYFFTWGRIWLFFQWGNLTIFSREGNLIILFNSGNLTIFRIRLCFQMWEHRCFARTRIWHFLNGENWTIFEVGIWLFFRMGKNLSTFF